MAQIPDNLRSALMASIPIQSLAAPFLLALLVLPLPAVAQAPRPAAPTRHPAVQSALASLRRDNEWTLARQAELCAIPAPPFQEAARGAALKAAFEQLGLRNVRMDQVGNVIGERPGVGDETRVALTAHLDTVFPDTTDVRVTRTGSVLRGPGIGDDCRGLAVILAVARALRDAQVQTTGTIVFVGTVGEEGPGNLRGVRHLFDRKSAGRLDAFLSVDGAGLDLTTRAVGSHRYRVVFQGPGGHSWGAFGMPNPVHALGRAIAAIAEFVVPVDPKTTFNVGLIEGGTSVNSIAMSAAMDVDFRSERQDALDLVDERFRRAVNQAVAREKAIWPNSTTTLEAVLHEIGRRPAAVQSDSAPIVQAALRAAELVGFRPAITASSTDANYPMSLGIPAVTIDGGGQGRGSHSLAESYDDGSDGWKGPQWALLFVLELVGPTR